VCVRVMVCYVVLGVWLASCGREYCAGARVAARGGGRCAAVRWCAAGCADGGRGRV